MGNDRSGRMTDNRELHTMEMTASGGWKTIGNCKQWEMINNWRYDTR